MRTRMNEGEWGDPEGQWGEYVEGMHIRMKKPRSGDPNSQLSQTQNNKREQRGREIRTDNSAKHKSQRNTKHPEKGE